MSDGREEARLEPIGKLGAVARRDELIVDPLEAIERAVELVGAHADLRLEADCGLEHRVGVGGLISRPLDTLHQCSVDLCQLFVTPHEIGDDVLQ